MVQISYHNNEPITGALPDSKPLRDNFTVLNNAASLYALEQSAPDRTVYVQSGLYYVDGTQVLQFGGGSSPTLDVFGGGTPTYRRYALLVIDSAYLMNWIYGPWVASPTTPTYPAVPSNIIPICLVLVTYGMSTITSGLITDVRPLVNLGGGGSGPGSTGVQGATGLDGPQGETGVAGDGITGPQGVTGLQGNTGIGAQGSTGIGTQGITGLQGRTGVLGATGLPGQQGATGLIGQTGIQGVTGQGATGFQGLTGSSGLTGLQGIQGPKGDTGVIGPQGHTGLQGFTGVDTIGSTGLQGPTGIPGNDGALGAQGVTGVAVQSVVQTIGGTGVQWINWGAGNVAKMTLYGNVVIGATGMTDGQKYILQIKNSGAFGITGLAGDYRTIDGNLPYVTGATGVVDYFGLIYDGTDNKVDWVSQSNNLK